MSNDDDKKKKNTGKTDFSKFRIPTSSSGSPVTKKVLMHVPVGKPSKQKFVRVHQDESYHFECALLRIEDDERPYLISPDIAHAVAATFPHAVDVSLITP